MASPILNVKIVGNSKKLRDEFSSAESAAQKFGAGLKNATVIATAALASVGLALKDAVRAASDYEQAAGAVEAVYGKHAEQIKKFSQNAATQVGISKTKYLEYSAIMGAQLKSLGLSQDEVIKRTDDLIRLGADLAATYGGPTSDAISAIGSLLRNEKNPIERYGIAIKEADVKARMASKGLNKLTGEAESAARANVLLELAFERAGGAIGQWGRESDKAANKYQIVLAKIEDTKARVGEMFLPYVEKALDKLEDLSDWANDNPQAFQAAAIAIGIVATAIWAVNAAIYAYNAAMALAGIVTKMSPIGWLITLLGILVGAVIYTITKWDDLKKQFWETFKWLQPIIDLWNKLTGAIQRTIDTASKSANVQKNQSSRLTVFRGSAYHATTPQVQAFSTTPLFYTTPIISTLPTGSANKQVTINITVNGATDSYETARQIQQILAKQNARSGEVII